MAHRNVRTEQPPAGSRLRLATLDGPVAMMRLATFATRHVLASASGRKSARDVGVRYRHTQSSAATLVIEVTRTTGASSLRRDVRVDSCELDLEQRQRITELVSRLNLDELERSSPILGSGAERFHYQITFKDGEDRHVVVDDSRLSGALLELIELLLSG